MERGVFGQRSVSPEFIIIVGIRGQHPAQAVAGDAADSATRRLASVSGLRDMHGEWLAQGVRAMAASAHP